VIERVESKIEKDPDFNNCFETLTEGEEVTVSVDGVCQTIRALLRVSERKNGIDHEEGI
jgi:hypothetical protein